MIGFERNAIVKIGLSAALCVFGLGLMETRFALAQTPPQAGRGAGVFQRGGRGMRAVDPRVQNRTYVFADTNETMPYAVFVSSKVTKDIFKFFAKYSKPEPR